MTSTPPPLPPVSDWETPTIRATVLAIAAANTVFWLWTFRFIAAHTNPKGDGFEWVAVMPFGFIFLLGALLPAMRAIRGPRAFGPGFNLGIALALVIGATMLNAMMYLQVLGEFTGTK
ncbi:hypothetical protein YH63_017675 [Afipia massiliensis]|uniref:Uncharacterized protein n=1 Tax=Afipia massiliensis TaxID=211460 RepID=A0A4U6BTV0_9BRAD|nr:hypothetical protein [Afipia massiliensis]TKT73105.1 hypothetical protein YH63_017675 [Afipia massiliensis]